MKNKKIEKVFFCENDNQRSKFITYLTYLHIANSLSKRDSISNAICKDNGFNYINKFKQLFSEMDHPLCFVNDDTFNLYSYTMPHIKKIMANPSQSIIKEKVMIQKSKLKVIDANTFRWLATKPGTTFKEKLANQEKVLSTVKKYSFNTKENQILVSFIDKIKNYFSDKKELILRCPELFGDINEYKDRFSETNKTINKINTFLKNDFSEVVKKEHITPNNILIGNVDYSSVWNANQSIKKESFEAFSIEHFYLVVIKCLELAIMSSSQYEFVDKNCIINNTDSNYLIYQIDKEYIREIAFDYDGSYILNVNNYRLVNGQYEFDDITSTSHTIDFQLVEEKNRDRGLAFEVIIDDEMIKCNADLIGTKELIIKLAKILSLELDYSRESVDKVFTYDDASINDYTNSIIGDEDYLRPHIIYDGNDSYWVRNRLYFANDDNVYINTYKDSNKYNELLKKCREFYKKGADSLLIYDIKDSFDEFSSKYLRNNYSTNFPNSYPVWRSILSAESVIGFNPDLVVDITGKEVYATALGRKNGLYVHKGVITWPLNLAKYSEYDFLTEYLQNYAEDNEIQLSDNAIDDCISSGALSELLLNKTGEIIILEGDEYSHEYIRITYDEEIFKECCLEINDRIDDIKEEYHNKKLLIVVPDYIDINNENSIINNNKLYIGANVVRNRVRNRQIAWYECLPDLSLEVIRDGYYDYLKLVDNKECENIIGKSDTWTINETFVLKAGKTSYSLPLIKSFIGEQNIAINAVIKDQSFPLNDDIEVVLKLCYSYGSENSYVLTFMPVNKKNAPFNKLIVNWEENYSEDCLKELPSIRDVELSAQKQSEVVAFISKGIHSLTRYADKRIKDAKDKEFASKDIARMANDYQKLLFSGYPNSVGILKQILSSKVPIVLEELYQGTKYAFRKNPTGLTEMRLAALEQSKVQFTLNRELFLKRELLIPEASYGRYLVIHDDDIEVINIAYNNLIRDYKQGDLLKNAKLKTYLDRLTSATQMDHLFFKKISKTNVPFVYKVLEIIIAVMKEISSYTFDFETATRENNPKEISYYMRFCVELLISYLYVREETYFEELRPNGRMANEIISYIKLFNKNYQNALLIWPIDMQKPRMETKYRMTYKDKPKELSRIWEDAYCLMLYLSGAKEANNIIIGSTEKEINE